MRQLRYQAAVTDPEGVLAELHAKESEMAQSLNDLRAQIKFVKKILDTRRSWAEVFGEDPEPEPEDDHPSPPQTPKTAPPADGRIEPVNVVSITPPPRRVQVVHLLSQEPTYWWKTRDIADALSISNHKSLRVLLGQLAQKGDLIKTADAWFRFNDGTSIPEPESTPTATSDGEAM